MINETTIKIALAIILTVFIVGIIKKAIKIAVIGVCIVIAGLFSYDFIVLGNNPLESMKNIKNDAMYIKDMSSYTLDIKENLNNIKKILSTDEDKVIKEEQISENIKNLKDIKTDIGNLKHSYRMDSINDNYLRQLNLIINTTENIQNNKQTLEVIDKFSDEVDEINTEIRNCNKKELLHKD